MFTFNELCVSGSNSHTLPGWQKKAVCTNYKTNTKYYCDLLFRVQPMPSFHTNMRQFRN